MKRSGPPARRTPLRNRKPMKRTPSARKPGVGKTKIPPKIREAVERRAGMRCEIQAPGVCEGAGYHCHHKLMRSQGGKHTVENLALTCARCHDYVHHVSPGWAYAHGHLIRSGPVAT